MTLYSYRAHSTRSRVTVISADFICVTVYAQNSLFEVVYSKDFYVSLLEPGYFSVVAVDPGNENRIVGVATARDCLDEYDLWTSGWECWQGRKSGYIMTLGVHGGYRRRGIGAELLRVRWACCEWRLALFSA